MSSTPVAPAAASVQQSQNDATLYNDIKDMTLYELQVRGYSPNPADAAVLVARILQTIKDSGGNSNNYVAAKAEHIKAWQQATAAQVAASKAADDAAADAAKVAAVAASNAKAAAAKAGQLALEAPPPLQPGAPIPAAA